MASKKIEIIIKDTHRGLWYEDGVLTKTLEAGRYEIPKNQGVFGRTGPLVEVTLVDIHQALFCNNEDWSDPKTRIWFLPAGEGYFGAVYVDGVDSIEQARAARNSRSIKT